VRKYSGGERLATKLTDILYDKPGKQLEHAQGNYYRDENGRVFEARSLAQLDGIKKRKQAEARSDESPYMLNAMKRLNFVIDTLTPAQCGYLLMLACHMNYEGTVVKSRNDQTPMNRADMKKALKLTKKRSTFSEFFSACLNHGIITELDGGAFRIASLFHFRGNADGEAVVKAYMQRVKEVYRKVKPEDIGLIYRMLPYVHRTTNALCANPDEVVPGSIRKFNRKELADTIGVTPQFISQKVKTMKFDGQPVFAKVTPGDGASFYMLNPSVFYRGKGAPDDTLLTLFGIKV
jgi:hypothetical protein